MGKFDQALICENGHLINSSMNYHSERNCDFCAKCGAKAIFACKNCQESIRGYYYGDWMNSELSYSSPIPAYCIKCGQPFPWTELKIKAIVDGLELSSGISIEEKEEFINEIKDLAYDNPRSNVAALKVKEFGKKITRNVWEKVLMPLIVEIASETAKKTLLG